MNRLAVGLAVGAGYVLGRTKKAKFAFAVGSMVAGKRLNLSPKALGQMVTQQLENNPQFKEIGDQLRQDLRGVGKAATGSLLNRQLEGIADRLHDRTLGVQDRISGVVPDEVKGGEGKDDREADDDAYDDEEPEKERDSDADSDADAESDDEAPSGQRKKAPAKRSAPKAGAKTASKTAAKKAPAKKTAQKTAARKTTQKKTAAASRGTARRATSSARSGGGRTKGGSDHG
ncbi:DNA primase [Streptomyces sp. Je 1-369]|uniref:DNA primase n=1 Tax=Streptomyces sp. Je 1-369 TaxID=2966192 RepID=UPI00228554D5|nr:DNA primase [Streptomyces sp. Je 1-369]WAL98961.1 DNA primase [Streptomyces sp. Je 1-369]